MRASVAAAWAGWPAASCNVASRFSTSGIWAPSRSYAATRAFHLVPPLVEVRGPGSIFPIDPGEKLLVDLFRGKPEIVFDHLRSRLQFRKRVDHDEQLFFAPLLLNKITDAAGLEVGD